ALAACPPAEAAAFADALHPWHRDDAWVRALLDQGVAALMDDPLADIRLSARPGVVIDTLGLIDAGHGAAALSIVAADGMGGPPDARIALDGGTTVLIALNDAGLSVDHFRLTDGDEADGPRLRRVGTVALARGDAMVLDHRVEQIRLARVDADALVLRFTLARPGFAPREYAADTGEYVRAGTASAQVSRLLALFTLVQAGGDSRAAGRATDVAAACAGLINHGDRAVRWQAMRHWLAADAMGAHGALCGMAMGDGDGELRALARATMAMMDERVAAHAA
ncbi:MAG: hypothetical protein ACKOUM_07580, partial [Sphingopyxis sp.]